MLLILFSLSLVIDFVDGILIKIFKKNLVEIYGILDFNQRLNHCLYGVCSNEMEFDSTWSEMIEMQNLRDNAWLDRLYHIQEKWCLNFNLDFFFSIMMKSTQRSGVQTVFFIKL